MKVVLELVDQNSNIKKVTVRHDIVIGRGADCNLRLSAPQVSRRHCFLRITGEGAFVSDLDSSNGTFLNGTKLTSGTRVELQHGATLSVGPVKFVAHVNSEVLAGDVLHVDIADDRIKAGSGSDIADAGGDYQATIAHSLEPKDLMDFAVEHVGPSAGDDDPTADYVSTTPGPPDFVRGPNANDSSLLDSNASDEMLVFDVSDDDAPTVAGAGSVSDAIIESVEIISVKDGDLLIIDDEDVADVVAESQKAETASSNPGHSETKPSKVEPPKDKTPAAEDDDETELRNFLNGLD